MKTVLFICWYNSARSQMAEAFLRNLGNGKFDVYSAGIESSTVHPLAIKVMQEIGIDISAQSSKTLQQYIDRDFDEVITVCDSANQACPIFPNAKKRQHWEFEDPEKFQGTDEEILNAFRETRDAIKAKIQQSFNSEQSD